jgi:hypothetical protein
MVKQYSVKKDRNYIEIIVKNYFSPILIRDPMIITNCNVDINIHVMSLILKKLINIIVFIFK